MTILCKNCHKEVVGQYWPSNRKFCNKSCAASFNNRAYPKRKKGQNTHLTSIKPPKVLNNCIQCETGLKPYQKKYCSNRCQQEYVFNIHTLPRILAGMCHHPKTLKKYVISVRGEVCELCGQGPAWNGKKLVLQLDHIDGNSDDSSLSNVRLLCPNCHTQTPTFSAKNHTNSKRNTNFRKYYRDRKEKITTIM